MQSDKWTGDSFIVAVLLKVICVKNYFIALIKCICLANIYDLI